jgi:hypothetical protein
MDKNIKLKKSYGIWFALSLGVIVLLLIFALDTTIELLSIFSVFYFIRYFMEVEYKNKKKIFIANDIIITSILAYIVIWIGSFFFH